MKLSMWAVMHDGNIFSHSQGQGHVGDDRQSLTGLIFLYYEASIFDVQGRGAQARGH